LIEENNKTIYRYDAGGKIFKKVAIFLVAAAVLLAVFGIIWLINLN